VMCWLMRVGGSGRLPCGDAEKTYVRGTFDVGCDDFGAPDGRQRSVNALCLLVPVQVVR
jgi:hypothetical protein